MTATTYTWAIASLERHTTDDIVYTAHWTVSASTPASVDASAEDASAPNASAYGSVGLEAPAEGDPVIPYEDLTEEIVIGWVKDKLGEEQVTTMEEALATQIAEQLAPSKATGTPWQ
jgi:hypothetical protein